MNAQPERRTAGQGDGRRLSDEQRLAVDLAGDLHRHLGRWLARRGVMAAVGVSPYVDPAGRPSVLVRMNAAAAHTLLCRLVDDDVVPPPPGRWGRGGRAWP